MPRPAVPFRLRPGANKYYTRQDILDLVTFSRYTLFRKLKEKSMVMLYLLSKVWTIRTTCGDVMSSTSGSRTTLNTTGRRNPKVADAKSESSSK